MGNVLKSVLLLFFVSVLSFISIDWNLCEKLPRPENYAEAGFEANQSIYSQSEQFRFQFLHRTGEIVVGSISTTPVSGAKDNIFGFSGVAHSIEQRLQDLTVQYLVRSVGISLSLRTGDIIFPFHYFW